MTAFTFVNVAPDTAPMLPISGRSDYALPLTGLDKTFVKYLQENQPSDDPQHALLAALTSYQFGRGHACLDLNALQNFGAESLGLDSRANSLVPKLLIQAADSLPWAKGENSPMVLDGHRLYLRRNWNAEQSIRAAIKARMAQPCDIPGNLAELLEKLFPSSTQSGKTTVPVPEWQKIACALAARKRLTLITGGPGTGKTTTVVRLLALQQSHANLKGTPLRIALAAPTGKAATRLSESIALALTGLPESMGINIPDKAVTLHKLLNIRPDSPGKTPNELAVDLVLVDEASMIDLEMMARLLAAVPLTASLILLGDKDQLASVEAGAVMGQLCEGAVSGNYNAETIEWIRNNAGADLGEWSGDGNELAQQTVMLRDSWRFSNDSGIGLWAKAVNAGETSVVKSLWQQAPEWASGETSEVTRIQTDSLYDERISEQIQDGWKDWLADIRTQFAEACTDQQALELLNEFSRFQVLCAVREGQWGVNSVNSYVSKCLGFNDNDWFVGRPVMVTRNDYNLRLMNGDVGLCLSHANGLRVAFPNGQGGIHWVLPSRLDAVETVFAMTVHKSQGSEFEHVMVILPDYSVAVLTRELLYTGITRAKKRLTLVVSSSDVLWRTVDKKVIRSGGLVDR